MMFGAPFHRRILGIVCASLAFATQAQAQQTPASVRLDYEAPDMGSACPSRESFEDVVAARLGYAPFSADGARRVVAHITRERRHLHATVAVYDENNTMVGERSFDGADLDRTDSECAELVRAMAVAISVSIDPASLSGPVAVPEPQTTPTTTPPPPTPTPAARETPIVPRPLPPSPLHFDAYLDAALTFLATPSWAIGPRVGLALRMNRFSIALEGAPTFQVSDAHNNDGSSYSANLIAASLVPCMHASFFQGCLVGSVGVLRAKASALDESTPVTNAWGALGVRAGAQLPLTEELALRLYAGLLYVVSRTELLIDQTVVWSGPSMAVDVGMGLSLRFF